MDFTETTHRRRRKPQNTFSNAQVVVAQAHSLQNQVVVLDTLPNPPSATSFVVPDVVERQVPVFDEEPKGKRFLEEVKDLPHRGHPYSWHHQLRSCDFFLSTPAVGSRFGTLKASAHIAIDRGGQSPTFVGILTETGERRKCDLIYRGSDLSLAIDLTNESLRRRLTNRQGEIEVLSLELFKMNFEERAIKAQKVPAWLIN